MFSVLLIISVLIIFPTAGCANLHCRSLESMLIPLKLCMCQLRFCASGWGGNAYDVLVSRGSDRQALCPFSSSTKIVAHFWPAQLSHPWQSHLCSRFLGPPHIPLTGSPASRSPSTPREVGTWLRCCLDPGLLPLVTDCLVTGQPKPFFSLPIFLAVVLP